MNGTREIHEGGGSMRDPHDLVTGELPEVEPLPPVPFEQLPQAQRIERMAYMGPRDAKRPLCCNCRFVCVTYIRPDSPTEVERYRCSVGDFPVQRGGVCGEFKADR